MAPKEVVVSRPRRLRPAASEPVASDGHRIPIVILTGHGDDEVQPGIGRWRGRVWPSRLIRLQ
jgi:hypothetical protein